MALLNLFSAVSVAQPAGLWEWLLLDVFGFIGDFGLRVIIFTVLLKVLLIPLDFYQKYKMKKNQRITQELEPKYAELKKQCGDDTRAYQAKQSQLNKANGFSTFSTCLPMIVTLVLFITLFSGLRSISGYLEFKQYVEMHTTYVVSYEETSGLDYSASLNNATIKSENANLDETEKWIAELFASENMIDELLNSERAALIVDPDKGAGDADQAEITIIKGYIEKYKTMYFDEGKTYSEFVDYITSDEYKNNPSTTFQNMTEGMTVLMKIKAQESTVQSFEENAIGFLWIKSIWMPDVPWKDSLSDFSGFNTNVNSYGYLDPAVNKGNVFVATDGEGNEILDETLFNDMANERTYEIVTAAIREDSRLYDTNGYLILIILVVGLSFLSQFITSKQQAKASGGNQTQMGSMKLMMWMMPIMLAVFALSYTSAFTLYMVTNSTMTILINAILTFILKLSDKKRENKVAEVVHYGRPDPNAPSDNNNKDKRRK